MRLLAAPLPAPTAPTAPAAPMKHAINLSLCCSVLLGALAIVLPDSQTDEQPDEQLNPTRVNQNELNLTEVKCNYKCNSSASHTSTKTQSISDLPARNLDETDDGLRKCFQPAQVTLATVNAAAVRKTIDEIDRN